MKIRTRLLLFLLPTLALGLALLFSLIAYSWYTASFPLELVLLCSAITLAITTGSLFAIAHRLSRPIQTLNNAALAIAAGQYGSSIQVSGPKEIVELANTLNTMSECLLENINRLKENSLLRERMYGEYECAMLLQHLMLQKNIDACRSDAFAVRPITFFSDNPRGLLLDFPNHSIHLAEAEEEGFEGMYELLTRYKSSKEQPQGTVIHLDRTGLRSQGPHVPLLWSLEERAFLSLPTSVQAGDYFFLYNRGMSLFYRDKIADLLSKVLRVFAVEGLDTLVAMLQKEIAFAVKRKEIAEDLHLLCFQILQGKGQEEADGPGVDVGGGGFG